VRCILGAFLCPYPMPEVHLPDPEERALVLSASPAPPPFAPHCFGHPPLAASVCRTTKTTHNFSSYKIKEEKLFLPLSRNSSFFLPPINAQRVF